MGGKIEVWIKGSPPIIPKWSLGNSNSGITILYEPWLSGNKYDSSQKLIHTSGDLKSGESKVTATLPGPGLLTAWVGQAAGSGPLSGSCFKQSFQARVSLVETVLHSPLRAGVKLSSDDMIETQGKGYCIISVPCMGDMVVGSDSKVQIKDDGRIFDLQSGILRGRSRSDCSAPAIKAGTYLITPDGTEYQVHRTDTATLVRVLSGNVTVTDPQGESIIVSAGYELSLPSGKIVPLQPDQDDGGRVDGIPLSEMLLDDEDPEPFGIFPASLGKQGMENGWKFIDPKNDATITASTDSGFTVTVPNENDIWSERGDAPRLFHKATGDFDLEADLTMTCAGQHLAISEFAIMAPGSHLGYLSKQMTLDSPASHIQLLGGGWYRLDNRNRLPLWDSKLAEGFDPEDRAIRFRLSRRGEWFITWWSADNNKWNLAGLQKINAPQTLWTGLAFKRMAHDHKPDASSVNHLRELILTTGEPSTLSLPKWLDIQVYGSIAAQGLDWSFQHDPDRMGALRKILSQPIAGDFDAVAKVNMGKSKILDGQGYMAGIQVVGNHEKDRTYVVLSDHFTHKGRYFTDMSVAGHWGDYQWRDTKDKKGWVRLVRQNGIVNSYYYKDGGWVRLDKFERKFEGELHLELISSSNWDAKKSSNFMSEIQLERLVTGAAVGGDYRPQGYTLMSELPLPSLNLSPNISAKLFHAPYPIQGPFFDQADNLYLFPSDKKRQVLIKLNYSGISSQFSKSAIFTGLNRKRGLWQNGKLLMTVDGWPDGGNSHTGLYEVNRDGTFKKIDLGRELWGLAGISSLPDGSLLLSDFESDGVWKYDNIGKISQLLKKPPTCPMELTVDPKEGAIYLANAAQGYSCSGKSGLFEVKKDGSLKELYLSKNNKNLGGMAWLNQGVFPEGLYATLTEQGKLIRLDSQGRTHIILEGLTHPSQLAVTQDSRTLAICLGERDLLLIRNKNRLISVDKQETLKKAQELLQKSRKLWKQGQLQQAVATVENARKLSNKDKEIIKTLKAMRKQKEQLDDKLQKAIDLINQGKLKEAYSVLSSAAMISDKYSKYIKVLQQLEDAKNIKSTKK